MYVNNMASQAAMREVKWRKGPWLKKEDRRLIAYVTILGERRWDWIAKISGLKRNGKSCRLRWLNYLRPGLKHGPMSTEEELTILQLHERWGNKWSSIAQKLPGRTDNEIKNYWRSCLRKSAQVQKEHKHGVAKSEKQNILMQEGNVGNTVNDFDVAGLSSSTFTNSAYGSHLLDWTVWLSIVEHHENGIDFCFCCPSKWCSEDDGSILWDWSASMWENS